MKTILQVVIMLSVCFLLGEFLTRTFYPQTTYSVENAAWGWRHIPNTTVYYYGEKPVFYANPLSRPKPVRVHYDRNGLRSFGWAKITGKPKQIRRIMMLGDSFLEDMGSSFENLISTRLQKSLNYDSKGNEFLKTGYGVQVINAGHYGFCDAQELLYYLMEGVTYYPDVVMLFYANDTANPKYAELKDGQLVLKTQDFSLNQRIYRRMVSEIRLHSQFGSLILNVMTNLPQMDRLLVKGGYKEHIPYTHIADLGPSNEDFAAIDKEIFKRFRTETAVRSSKFVILKCLGDFSPKQKDFLDQEGIPYLFVPESMILEGEKEKARDLMFGSYDPKRESARFGYKANEKIARLLESYILNNNLI